MLTEIRWTVTRMKTVRSHMMVIEPTVAGHYVVTMEGKSVLLLHQ